MSSAGRASSIMAATTTTTTIGAMATATDTPPRNITAIIPYTTDLNGVNMTLNVILQNCLWWSLGILAMLVLFVRLAELFRAHLRHISAMSASRNHQTYWSQNGSSWLPWVKKNLLYAPLGKKRHNREMRLSSAMNMGTLPSRFHTVLLVLYLISNIIYMALLSYSNFKYEVIAELRGRSGTLAVVNMIPLVILAGRNNPLITLLKISFDTYNLIHRWMGRMIVLEVIVHIIAWTVCEVAAFGWSGWRTNIASDPFISYGAVGACCMILILFLSPSPLRHAFYETFLNIHIILATLAIFGIWIHCNIAGLPQLPYITAVFFLWLGDRLGRFYLLISCNFSRHGWTTATVEIMPGEACRVTLHLPRHVTVKPGSHANLRFGSIGFWESHPFSIAWTSDSLRDLIPKAAILPVPVVASEKDSTAMTLFAPKNLKTDVSFVIHAHTGITRRLHDLAAAAKKADNKPAQIRAALEGPYGGHHSLDSYGHVLLFAGSSGITHQVPYLRHLVAGHHASTVATRRVTLVWVVRDLEHLEWVRPWMDEILQLPGRREVLQVKLFVTRPKSSAALQSPSTTVRMFPGRPNVRQLVADEMLERCGAMAVTVCGPGSLADNVREAVREVVEVGVVDFVEESFTW